MRAQTNKAWLCPYEVGKKQNAAQQPTLATPAFYSTVRASSGVQGKPAAAVRTISAGERKHALLLHRSHALFLIARACMYDRAACDEELQVGCGACHSTPHSPPTPPPPNQPWQRGPDMMQTRHRTPAAAAAAAAAAGPAAVPAARVPTAEPAPGPAAHHQHPVPAAIVVSFPLCPVSEFLGTGGPT